MDGENNGKPYFLMDDLGGKPTIFGNTHVPLPWGAKQGRLFWVERLSRGFGEETPGGEAEGMFWQGRFLKADAWGKEDLQTKVIIL